MCVSALTWPTHRFWAETGRFPGWQDQQVKGDIPALKHHVEALLTELGLNSAAVSENAVHEMYVLWQAVLAFFGTNKITI